MNAQRHVGALHDVGRENVAVVEAACGQRRIEHPRSGANADGFVAGLLSNPHGQVLWRCYRRVLRQPAQEAINIPPQPRIQNLFKHALRIPRRRQLHRWRHHELSSRRRCSADEESCGPTARAPRGNGLFRRWQTRTPKLHAYNAQQAPAQDYCTTTSRPPHLFRCLRVGQFGAAIFTAMPRSAVASNENLIRSDSHPEP